MVCSISSIDFIESCSTTFTKEKMVLLFHALFASNDALISDQIILSLAKCVKNGFPLFEVFTLPVDFLKQLNLYCTASLSLEVKFFGRYLIHKLVSVMQEEKPNGLTFETGGLFVGSENMLVFFSNYTKSLEKL